MDENAIRNYINAYVTSLQFKQRFLGKWGVTLHGTPEQLAANKRRGACIQYADLSDLMLMLDIKVGGGVMAIVNEGQRLVRTKAT